ncbi:MAG: TetR/AcrR family transcriptional regulator [Hylemonella sp.]|uniref:TetR/AcrR family transcriptional regulator n=1 Tax=Hylemonella sp. TaxID=2066020 RepID=UPI0022C617A7|nr:TetR/AcrR family transcriptional regulator [Hylemonella sp.]MCZ8252147.1 TetR/AcrR family transcriptional regulator [Hylemonella sp.]
MRPKTSLSPRKKPVQSRSTHTVEAIFDATIQVLLAVGVEGLTTTRVAERAGVSVGTLYQYFPHKQALLAAVLERHLLGVVEAAEQACRANRGRTVLEISAALVEAFVRAKFSDADASRALYAVAPAVGGEELVTRLTQRGQIMLCEVLASASDRTFNQLATVSYVVSTALIGPIQGLLTSHAQTTTVEHVRDQLSAMIGAYLMAVGSPRESA